VSWVFSTPNGNAEENFFHWCCNNPESGFKQFYAPSIDSPYVPADELEKYRLKFPPLVFTQEYLAEFVDWSGSAFFDIDKMLVGGKPVEVDWRVDQVFAVIDSASKTDAQHDSTGVIFCAKSIYGDGYPLVILDYDIVKIEASLLADWIPWVNQRLEELSTELRARQGNFGIWIEDKDSGVMLNQAIPRTGIQSHPIDQSITSIGKEGRSISASPYVWQEKVKFSRYAFDKVKTHNQQSKNHLVSQVGEFRMGMEKKEYKGRRDLLDCFTYSVLIALGDSEGY
jgi:hypothetical protein